MKPSVLFLGSTYAGHATRFANLQVNVEEDDRLQPSFSRITGWNAEGRLERLPGLPRGTKGRIRATLEAVPFAKLPRPDLIWTSGRRELAPFAATQWGPFRRQVVLDLDATDRQLETMAYHYFGRSPKRGSRRLIADAQEALVRSAVTVYSAWSNWAKDGLVQEGVPSEHVRVIPPGIDLERWEHPRRETHCGPLRILFVGADFARKGGDMLVDAVARRHHEFELTLVTPASVSSLPRGARIVSASPNSQELRDAFAWADLFVMPSRAECFGIATVEAMASGLPVIIGDVGGARDIVAHGETGWLIEPNAQALEHALDRAVHGRTDLRTLGGHARKRVERLFDGRRNDKAVVDLILDTLATE